jgi:hypothetical protein
MYCNRRLFRQEKHAGNIKKYLSSYFPSLLVKSNSKKHFVRPGKGIVPFDPFVVYIKWLYVFSSLHWQDKTLTKYIRTHILGSINSSVGFRAEYTLG